MILGKPDAVDPALMADLLQSTDFTGDQSRNYQVAKRVVAKAPDLQSAQIGLAFGTAFMLSEIPREERGEALAEARRAAERAMALGPDFGDTYATWCMLHSETRIAECEDRLRAGKRADPDAPFLNTFLSHLLRSVGRFEESTALANLAHTHDIYVPTKIAWVLKSLEYGGESDRARELHQQGAKWWPEYKDSYFYNRVFGLLERGDFNAIQRLEKDQGAKSLPSKYQDSAAIVAAVKSKSTAAMRGACTDTGYILSLRCMIASASIGDLDGAYAIADRLYPRRIGRTPAETERIWLDDLEYSASAFITAPAAAPMRRDPRYLQLVERIGLLAYWRSGRPPDFCRKQPEPICTQLLKRA